MAKHSKPWESKLETYAYPVIESLDVGADGIAGEVGSRSDEKRTLVREQPAFRVRETEGNAA